MKKSNFLYKVFTCYPIIVYSFVLILLPAIYILYLSFCTSDYYGGVLNVFTLNNYFMILDLVYIKVLLKSLVIGIITTVICLLIAYPFSIFISHKKNSIKSIFITLVILPFLTNSLVRTYGWIVILRKEGLINTVLSFFHVVNEPLELMYNDFGIIVGMVYALLPFMILPVFSAVDKIDPSVIDASKDLGAGKLTTFFRVTLPLSFSGAFNGSMMVFIPAIGYFFISDILGGGKLMLIGNLIKNQFLVARNWPFGATIAVFLIVFTLILVRIYKKIGGNMDDLGGL